MLLELPVTLGQIANLLEQPLILFALVENTIFQVLLLPYQLGDLLESGIKNILHPIFVIISPAHFISALW